MIIGITALVPPELIFSCGHKPYDLNNIVPISKIHPKSKLCAWTSIWSEMVSNRRINIDSLIVVAGGDCHNALIDGQKAAFSGIQTHYFFYPFDADVNYLESQLYKLSKFLGGIKYPEIFKKIKKIKSKGLIIDKKRCEGLLSPVDAFEILISFSDFEGDIDIFEKKLDNIKFKKYSHKTRIALIGVPPIYYDFHKVALELGLYVVFDELAYEFVRHSGENIHEIAYNYSRYTFARPINYRIDYLKKELKKRKIDGIIHYTQFACHHILEDEIFRKELDYPFLTIQGDLPGKTPEQIKLRLEAFREMIERHDRT